MPGALSLRDSTASTHRCHLGFRPPQSQGCPSANRKLTGQRGEVSPAALSGGPWEQPRPQPLPPGAERGALLGKEDALREVGVA